MYLDYFFASLTLQGWEPPVETPTLPGDLRDISLFTETLLI